MGISFGHGLIKAHSRQICNNIGVKNFDDLKIAIVRDQLTQYGGAERVLEALLDIFPYADIFAGVVRPINIPNKILKQKIFSSRIPAFLGFLMPFVYENFDLRSYDIIISEGTAWPKGVITNPWQLHVSYIYTPPRFLYGYATEGQKRDKWYFKPFLKVIDHFLLVWDFAAAQKPDYILTISQEVAKRVKKFYRRDSLVIYPPVDLPAEVMPNNQPANKDQLNEYYLCVSRLAAYKNIDLLINAFKLLSDFNLKIIGTGKEEPKLLKLAAGFKNIELLGFVTEQKKFEYLRECKGFIFPTDYEDFGIAPLEALACGKPVLSHRSGGPLEFIEENATGMFFELLTPQHLADKIKEFDQKINKHVYDGNKAILTAKKFSSQRFKKEFKDFVSQKWEELNHARTT